MCVRACMRVCVVIVRVVVGMVGVVGKMSQHKPHANVCTTIHHLPADALVLQSLKKMHRVLKTPKLRVSTIVAAVNMYICTLSTKRRRIRNRDGTKET